MNIIKNKKVVKSFGQYIDQLNTLSGGISMAHIEVLNKNHKMVVRVMAPSVSPDNMQVVVDYDKLVVYATLPQAEENGGAQNNVNFPLFAQVVPIPFHVAVEQIEAVYQDGELRVNLPYAEDRNIKRQAIRIRKK
jgi:HSP20 family protein